jgi:hypothetical protein
MKYLKIYLPLIIIIALSFWAVKPLFNPGFFPIHDDTQVARVHQMHKALNDGMFPVRWVPDLGYGYGYPIFNFYAPLAYYIGAFFMFLGFGALSATKIMIGLGIVVAGICMYFLSKEFWGKIGGVISALLYVYAPYHALNAYVRGAIAELWAYAFLPLAFFSVYKVYLSLNRYTDLKQNSKLKNKNAKLQLKFNRYIWIWTCASALSYAAIIISHNLTAMMVSPFIFVFAFYLYVKIRISERIYKPYFVLIGLLIGILLSAFYWLPVPFEMKFTDVLSVIGGGSDYRDHFACITQLWSSPWGFAGSAPGCVDGFSLKIGKIHILLSLMSLPALLFLYRIDKKKFSLSILFIIFLLFSVFLAVSQSKFIWDVIPQMAFFQFPWRFLILITFLISFLGGAGFWIVENTIAKNRLIKYVYWLGAILVAILIIILDSKVFIPQQFSNKSPQDYISEYELKWRVSKISDEYMPKDFLRPVMPSMVPREKIVTNKDVTISDLTDKTNYISFTAGALRNTEVNVNLAYFPGWHVYIDGKQQWFGYSKKDLVLQIPAGEHKVDIKFTQTPIEKVGNSLSAAGVLLLIIGIINTIKKNKYGSKIT